jgi:hypothetical protein
LKRPNAKEIQNTEENSPKSTALRIAPISASLGSVEAAWTRTMVVIGHAKLSNPNRSVDQAQTDPIVGPRHKRKRRMVAASITLHSHEKGPQTSHAPMVATRVADTALIVMGQVGMVCSKKGG